MSFLDFAFRMAPYWSLGAFMGWAVWKSDYKSLLAFDAKAFGKWCLFLTVISFYRYYMLKLAIHAGIDLHLDAVKSLPVGATAFVGWEDLAHSLPLVLLRRMIGTSKWTWPIHGLCTTMVLVSFLSGHLYQGLPAACFISLYILFGIHFGQKRGFGTLMLGHMAYDFSTIMTIRLALGL